MGLLAFRKLLGADGRRKAWCLLGAEIDETARIGARVWMRFPERVSIGAGTRIGRKVWIDSGGGVSIGSNVLVGDDVDILSVGHLTDSPGFQADRRKVTIGDYVWLPYKIIVLPGVSIGSHAVIGTGSVVTRDIPDYVVAAGNPARVVKERARTDYRYVPADRSRPDLVAAKRASRPR